MTTHLITTDVGSNILIDLDCVVAIERSSRGVVTVLFSGHQIVLGIVPDKAYEALVRNWENRDYDDE